MSWAAPASTTAPLRMTTMRSAMSATTPKSWVMKMTPMPMRRWMSLISPRICACVVTSSAVVGSSAISTSGSRASAIAITTRCRCPPDNWNGKASIMAAGSGSSTCSNNSSTRCLRAEALSVVWRSSTSSTCRPTRMMGFSAVMGSWNTMPNDLPRKPYQSVADKPTRSRPPYRIFPCVILS
ncbi:hypothetical protein D3C71_1376930 [compost metagenome]